MRARFLWLGLLVIAALPVGEASAQQWLSDRSRAEGRGITAGPLVLHPGVGAEVGYDTNVFLAEPGNTDDSAILRISPHFDVATPDKGGKVSFRGGVNASFRRYFSTGAGWTIGLGENLRLKWQPVPIFGWEIFQDLSRTAVPFTDPSGPMNMVNDDINFGRNQIGVGTRLQMSSRSGLLKVGLGYRLDLDIFDATEFDANDTKTHTIAADTSWEFLPKTALFWGGAVKLRKFDDPGAPSVGERNDSIDTSSRIGINGALTDRIGFTLATGYSAGFYEDNGDYENVTAQIEGRYKLSESASFSLGYDRTTTPSYFGNSSDTDRIKGSLQAMFGGKFVLGLKAEFTFISFGADDELNSPDRLDKLLVTNLNGEYRFTDWFALTGELGFSKNLTRYAYPAMGTGAMMVDADPAKWTRFEAWLGVRAFL